MRIDKYLWAIRLFKTRNIASGFCKKGQVKMNNNSCKPSRDIYVNDIITIRKDQINYKIQVLNIPESRLGAKLVDLYRKDLTPREEFDKKELLKYSKDYYRQKGSGRPTKKDRRDIDEYNNSSN
jgi:ribosome-associated heat shock protein Hsp15